MAIGWDVWVHNLWASTPNVFRLVNASHLPTFEVVDLGSKRRSSLEALYAQLLCRVVTWECPNDIGEKPGDMGGTPK